MGSGRHGLPHTAEPDLTETHQKRRACENTGSLSGKFNFKEPGPTERQPCLDPLGLGNWVTYLALLGDCWFIIQGFRLPVFCLPVWYCVKGLLIAAESLFTSSGGHGEIPCGGQVYLTMCTAVQTRVCVTL